MVDKCKQCKAGFNGSHTLPVCENCVKSINNKTPIKIQIKELDGLKEYKEAYYYLLEYWDSFGKEQQEDINKDLNKIFILNDGERINGK